MVTTVTLSIKNTIRERPNKKKTTHSTIIENYWQNRPFLVYRCHDRCNGTIYQQ